MTEPAPQTACPFVAQLVAMLLADDPAALRCNRARLYARLIDLERDATRCGAPRATIALIGRVRRIAGSATILRFPVLPAREARADHQR